ncbi:MAG: rhomboid family intramembrane serine protease [Gemmatimonadaceae bacterium]|nr:rhomboid family intramembrane serine protease [Gemmatimonadaceae bacterium]
MTPWVQRLLIANILVFFVQMTAPETTQYLQFVPALVLQRPWGMVTYMFVHGGFIHILFNMMALYFFGPRVEQRIGSERFIVLYLVSGFTGALFSIFFAPFSPIIGASGAVFGVMLAFARFWPTDQIFIYGIIPVQARWLVAITTVMALFSGLTGTQAGVAHFAHLGGYAGAFLFLVYLERQHGARRFQRQAVAPVADPVLGNWRQVDTASVHAVNREEVDRILDKISASGLASLTMQERQFLSNFVPPDDRKPVS